MRKQHGLIAGSFLVISNCVDRNNREVFMEQRAKVRLHLLDGIRGMVLISMIAYHFSWNMVYLYGADWRWYHGTGAYFWQQSICWTFILLSGFCWSMGRKPLKRGMLIFGGGLLVTAVTLLVMPQNRVVFGVLTLIGSSMLLLILIEPFWKNIPKEAGAVISFSLFLLCRHLNQGYLGFETFHLLVLPESWYQNLLTAYLGMPPKGFYSTDYFPLFPWFFLFVTGYFLFGICEKRGILQWKILQKKLPFVDFLGKNSFLVYLLHQPVLYAVLEGLRQIW